MKKRLFNIMFSLVIMAAMNTHHAMGQVPPLSANVVLMNSNGNPSNNFSLNEPIRAVISLENVGIEDIYAATGITDEDFRVLLRFTLFHPDGTEETIPATYQTELPDPPPPPLNPCQVGEPVQVDAVDTLPSGWERTIDPFDVLNFYPLDRTGLYEVMAVLSMIRTYPQAVLQTCEGVTYAPLASANFEEPIVSNTIEFHIIDDDDEDGFFYPQPYGDPPDEADCDDSNADVHPDAVEIPGNGIDDDCDPETPDQVASLPGIIVVEAIRYTFDRNRRPRWTREPVAGLPVRVYDRSVSSCIENNFPAAWRNREAIWWSCNPPQATGETDASGMLSLSVPPGRYLVIGGDNPDEDPRNGNEFYVVRPVNNLQSGQTRRRYLQFY